MRPNPFHTALEAIRVAVDGGDLAAVGQTISAELNDAHIAGGAISVLAHSMETACAAAAIAAECLDRAATVEGRTPRDMYDELRVVFSALATEDGDSVSTMTDAARTICEKCKQPLSPDAPDAVRAQPYDPVDGSDELLDVNQPVVFHKRCYPGDSDRLRRI